MSALWRVMFLAERYGRMTMTLDEVAEQIGVAAATIRNRRVGGEFAWFKTDGRSLYADVADVAAYLEDRRSREQGGALEPINTLQPVVPARYVLPKVAYAATGYTVKAQMHKIEEGVWVEGAEWVKAPDGRRRIDLRGYERWAAGHRSP